MLEKLQSQNAPGKLFGCTEVLVMEGESVMSMCVCGITHTPPSMSAESRCILWSAGGGRRHGLLTHQTKKIIKLILGNKSYHTGNCDSRTLPQDRFALRLWLARIADRSSERGKSFPPAIFSHGHKQKPHGWDCLEKLDKTGRRNIVCWFCK